MKKIIEQYRTNSKKMKSHVDYPKLVDKTSFLPEKTTPAQRVWHVINDNWEVQLCKMCDNSVPWVTTKKTYKKTCSKECNSKYQNSDEYKDLNNATRYPDWFKIKEYTKFLPISCTPNQRIWHWERKDKQIPKCITCQSEVHWNKSSHIYNQTCSKSCKTSYQHTKDYIDKKKATTVEKYGVDNYRKTQECSDRIKVTCLEKYGADHYWKTQEGQDSIKATNLEKYGVDNYRKTEECQSRIEKTCLEKYGVTSYSKTDDFKDKCKSTNLERYGVDNYRKTQECQDRIEKTCLEKYGVTSYAKTQECQDRIEKTCLEKYGVTSYAKTQECQNKTKATSLEKYGVDHYSKQHISKFNINRIANYHFMRYWYTEKGMSSTDLGNKLGVDYNTALTHLRNLGIPINHNHSRSYAEREIEEFLINQNILVEASNRDILDGKEIDLYLPEFKIGIEYNGLYWHSVSPKNKRMDRKYHARKTQECNELGIRLIQIFEDEWTDRKDQVKAKLLSLIGKDPRSVIYARKCKILKVTTKTKTEFFDTNHIQGSGPGSINIGLVYEGELVACMSFIKQKSQHYLNRYATSHRIPGGFSKLLKYFKNNYQWDLLISFADLRWSDGNLYQKTGWKLDKTIPEDYAYVVGDTRVHKFNYRRKFLPDKLETFDPSLSETKNCANNGLYPIYDCGKLRYIMKNN